MLGRKRYTKRFMQRCVLRRGAALQDVAFLELSRRVLQILDQSASTDQALDMAKGAEVEPDRQNIIVRAVVVSQVGHGLIDEGRASLNDLGVLDLTLRPWPCHLKPFSSMICASFAKPLGVTMTCVTHLSG